MHVLVVNFNLNGVSEQQYSQLCDDIAPSFAAVPGLVSKMWLADSATGTYGGVYVWEDRAALERFKASDLFKGVVSHPNLANISAKDFSVMEAPSRVTHALLTAHV
jgi:hypothetical protein